LSRLFEDISELFGRFDNSSVAKEQKFKELIIILNNIFGELFEEKNCYIETVTAADEIFLIISTETEETYNSGIIYDTLSRGLQLIKEHFFIEISFSLSELYSNLGYLSNLLISAAHLKVGNERNKDSAYMYDGKLEDFLGCNLTGQKYRSNKGFKFAPESNVKGVFYPGAADYTNERIDPVGSDGYVTYAEIEEKNCRTTAFLGKNFATTAPDYENRGAVLVENSYGKGNVLFMCSDEYPGAYGVYTLYKIIVKAILAGTHRNAEIKVIGSDKVRFCVYEDESKYKIYLLNTDMNFEQKIRVLYNGESKVKSVPSTGLDFIELKK